METKYNLPPLEEYIAECGEKDGTIEYYNTFLLRTDHIPLKIFEGSLTSADCIEELEAREYARMKLAELNEEDYSPKASKNIEERANETETIISALLGVE